MKTYLLLGTLLCSHAHAAGEGFVNFIRQQQKTTGVVWSMPVVPVGNGPSQLPLEQDGALFQLWTIEQATAKDHLLDQKLVGAYLPSAAISIRTLDPYSAVPRTRADQPFTVTFNVSGLLSGAGLPEASTRVLLEHHIANYKGAQKSIPAAQALSGTPLSSSYLIANGTSEQTFAVTNLKAADATLATGEEHFVIHALGDDSAEQTQLATAHVQVWPVASGTIQGIAPGERVRFHAPALTVNLNDLYPRSNTWIQVYKGGPQLNTAGTQVTGSVLILDQDRSDSRMLTVSDYDTALTDDGTYTMELLTETPFGIDRLHHVTFVVDRKLEIRAQLGGVDAQ
jgi:hypothetical protein